MNNKSGVEVKRNIICVAILSVMSFLTYVWTIKLPIVGDGLMHLNDSTDIGSLKNIIKAFYTFDGIGKPEGTATLGFHRPVFDEIIVEVIKNITGCSIMGIRIISVAAFVLMIIVSYFLGIQIFENYKKAICLAIFMNFGLVYFSGVYEFGLSFSLWLTLFLLVAFYNTVKYVKYNRMQNLVGTFLFSAITMYTKESAMTLGIALSWYVLLYELYKNRRITKRIFIYGFGQFVILLVYLLTRYIKLGNFFTAGGGVDAGGISIIESIKKVIGYYFFLLNIPNRIIPNYMCIDIDKNLVWLGILMCGIPIAILVYLVIMIIKKNPKAVDILAYMGMYLVLILPVLKVSRNAPYYGDILAVFVILSMLTMIDIDIKRNRGVIAAFFIAYVTVYITNISSSLRTGSLYYLSMQANEIVDLREKLLEVKEDIGTDKILMSDNWIKNSSDLFLYHHNGFGSFYKFNVDKTKEIDAVNAENVYSGATIIDFYMNYDTEEVEIFTYPDENNKIVRVEYDAESNEYIAIGFLYEGYYYYSSIDMNFVKDRDEDNYLFFVIPAECGMDVAGENCVVEYID